MAGNASRIFQKKNWRVVMAMVMSLGHHGESLIKEYGHKDKEPQDYWSIMYLYKAG